MVRIRRTLAIIAMLTMAISANAWPWLSPYAYCMNNPVKFVDLKTLTVNGPVFINIQRANSSANSH